MSGFPANYRFPDPATSPDLTGRTNQQQAFYAKITGNAGSGPVRHSWVEMVPVPISGGTTFVVKDGGRVGQAAGPNPAVALDGGLIPTDTIIMLRIGTYDAGGSFDWVYLAFFPMARGGAPQPTLDLTLPSASNSDVDIGDLSGGYKWVRVVSSPANPTSITSFSGGQDGVLIEVTNATANDLELVDGSGILCPTDLDGVPAYNLMHPRESQLLKYDGTAAAWRVLERLPHVVVGGTDGTGVGGQFFARSQIQFQPCCVMSIIPVDYPQYDTLELFFGVNGLTTTVQVVTATSPSTTTATLHFKCGVLTEVTTP